MNVAYVRVSTVEQNEARQIEALKAYNIGKWFTEKVSAKDANRPRLKDMLDYVRGDEVDEEGNIIHEGDTIYILDFSRLARSTSDLLHIVEQLDKNKIHLVSLKENIDTHTPTGRLLLTMISAINEFERANLLERQREGIALAKRDGKYRGGQVKQIDESVFRELYQQYSQRKINKVQFSQMLGVSRPTLDKLLKDRQQTATA